MRRRSMGKVVTLILSIRHRTQDLSSLVSAVSVRFSTSWKGRRRRGGLFSATFVIPFGFWGFRFFRVFCAQSNQRLWRVAEVGLKKKKKKKPTFGTTQTLVQGPSKLGVAMALPAGADCVSPES